MASPTSSTGSHGNEDRYALDAELPTTGSEQSAMAVTSRNKKPSADFLKRRHQRMWGTSGPPTTEDEEDPSVASTDTEHVKHISKKAEGKGAISSASPTAIRSFRQLRAKRKSRVPGGAAAKLIGKTAETEPRDKYAAADDGDEPVEIVPNTDEFIKMRDEAKVAFSVGTKENRRYHASVTEATEYSERTDRSIPSALSRSEAFHESAAAAVQALLEIPNESPSSESALRRQDAAPLGGSFSSSKDFTQAPAIEPAVVNKFQAPPRNETSNHSRIASGLTRTTVADEDFEQTTKGKNPLEQPLLSKKTEQRVAQMKEQMKDPNKTLADLISAIASASDGVNNRGYLVRRKNACGALQVLTAKSVHRVQICWTVGVLPALSTVLEDSGNRDLDYEFPDPRCREEFSEARKRAVSSLMNLSMPPENRLAVFHTPRLVSNVVRVINVDPGEARKGCCAVLAHLAKTKENRLLMVQVPGLIDAITKVIEPKPQVVAPKFEDEDVDEDVEAMHTFSTNDASTGAPGMVESGLSGEEKIDMSESSLEVLPIKSADAPKTARRYDDDPNEYLHGARQNVFALLGHLFKEKDNAYILARHKYLIDTLVNISKLHASQSHVHAVKLLAHLTRHRGNSKHLVFKARAVVPVLVKALLSVNDNSRKHACFALQNLSQDKPCRQELAVTPNLLTAICVRIRQASDKEERLSAIQALKSLTDEPSNLIPMTNTPECFATLMQIAHATDDSVTDSMQYLGCDALATMSHWFRSIATSGQRIDATKRGLQPSKNLFVPTLQIVTYQQWQ